jgi:tetratricopeptide (TPR) repeat protein
MTYPYDLGAFSRKVTAGNAAAQLWFDRGLNWLYGFNHKEAIACFRRAAEADPTCAMAHWGHAYAAGPNYNMPWVRYDDDGRAKALAEAYDAAQAALALTQALTPAETAIVNALALRYPQRSPDVDMASWDRAFATAIPMIQRLQRLLSMP